MSRLFNFEYIDDKYDNYAKQYIGNQPMQIAKQIYEDYCKHYRKPIFLQFKDITTQESPKYYIYLAGRDGNSIMFKAIRKQKRRRNLPPNFLDIPYGVVRRPY